MSPIRSKLKTLPDNPGTYLFKNSRGQIIYVGKAKNLKKRVRSYFQASKRETFSKLNKLVSQIDDVELMLTTSEIEALLLERTLIRHHQPPFNVLLRDDKEYPYVKVNFKDEWPRIEKVRRRKDDGATYVGPFGQAGQLNTLLKLMGKVFPLIRCSKYEFMNARRPCNYFNMKMCLAPCCLDVDRNDYIDMIRDALQLLRGMSAELTHELINKMKLAASRQDYERAAILRDQINALKYAGRKQTVVIDSIVDADAISLHVGPSEIVIHVLQVRDHHVLSADSFQIRSALDDEAQILYEFCLQYYDSRYFPPIVITRIPVPDFEQLDEVFTEGGRPKARNVTPAKGPKFDLLKLADKNARQYIEQEAQLKIKKSAELESLREFFNLPNLPRRLECIDISNLGDTAIVASDVCFIDGKPAKDLYRKYNIQGGHGQDDFASIAEVVERRLKRGIEHDDLPDVLVIDGGKGQLGAALEAQAKFPSIDILIVSLAKSKSSKVGNTPMTTRSFERVFFPANSAAVPLRPGSPAFRLLTQIRDEAHRFAISHHRRLRKKVRHGSALDEIPGIGEKSRMALLTHFGSVDQIRLASLDQILKVPGITATRAESIYTYFRSEDLETK